MNFKLLILGMMVVTMIPRVIPLYMLDAERLPAAARTFLGYIPYAVLGALILPGGLTGASGNLWASLSSLAVAAVIAWRYEGIIGPVLGAVLWAVVLSAGGFI